MAATLHSGIIPGAEAKKLYSYPTLPANSEKLLLGNGTWGSVYHHPTQYWATKADATLMGVTGESDRFGQDVKIIKEQILAADQDGQTSQDEMGNPVVPPNGHLWLHNQIFNDRGHWFGVEWVDVSFTHPTVSAVTGKPTANQTPAFGATFTVSQVSRDSLGHVSGITDRTVKIPNSAASSTAAGLMSAADKKNVDSLVSMFNGSWTTSIDASGCMVVKAANGAQIFKIDKAGEW